MPNDFTPTQTRLLTAATAAVMLLLILCAWVGEAGALAAHSGLSRAPHTALPVATLQALNLYSANLHWAFAGLTAVAAITLRLLGRPLASLVTATALTLLWMLISTAALAALNLPNACLCDAWRDWNHRHPAPIESAATH